MNSDEMDEIKRHFKVVAEDLQSTICLSFVSLAAKIDRLEYAIDRLGEAMEIGFAEAAAEVRTGRLEAS